LKRADIDLLLKTKVAQIKQSTGENFRPANSWANTWRISARDHGATLTADQDDLIRIDLEEAAGSGFQWNLEELMGAGFEIVSDRNEITRDPVLYGGAIRRTLIARPPETPVANIDLSESQPWQASPENDRHLHVSLILSGKESGGLSRVARMNRGAMDK
jgi:hypothetical protein